MVYRLNGTQVDEPINALAWGAKGNGMSDDSDALNAILNAFQWVFLPAGTYLISKTIIIPDGVVVFGEGNSTKIQLASSFNLTGYPWRDSYKYPLLNVGANCVLRDFLVNGDETLARDQGQVGVLIHGDNTFCENIFTKNINYFPDAWIGGESGYGTVNAPGYGMFILGADNVSVKNCSFVGNGYQGIGVESANYADIEECYVGDGNRTGIQVHRYAKHVIVANCIVNNANTNKHADLTIHGMSDDYIDDISIFGCKFLTACEEKASIQTVTGYEKNIIIEGCIFNSANRCVSLQHDRTGTGTSNRIIIANNIMKSLTDGIYVRGDYCTITGNIVECPGTDITVTGTHKIVENNLAV